MHQVALQSSAMLPGDAHVVINPSLVASILQRFFPAAPQSNRLDVRKFKRLLQFS